MRSFSWLSAVVVVAVMLLAAREDLPRPWSFLPYLAGLLAICEAILSWDAHLSIRFRYPRSPADPWTRRGNSA